MFRKIILFFIKQKNPNFSLDDSIGAGVLLSLVSTKMWAFIRGLKIMLAFKKPGLLFLGKGVRFFNLHNISFGKWVQLDDFVFVSALGKHKLVLGNNVKIGAFSRIVTATSFNHVGEFVKIGNNVGIGEFAYLGGGGGLTIGDDCIVGQYLSCHPENHNFTNTNELIRLQGVTRKGIVIGKNCWIGAKVTVLDGVTVGDNCVIAAGAVITKSMPANSVIGGVPARVLKSIA